MPIFLFHGQVFNLDSTSLELKRIESLLDLNVTQVVNIHVGNFESLLLIDDRVHLYNQSLENRRHFEPSFSVDRIIHHDGEVGFISGDTVHLNPMNSLARQGFKHKTLEESNVKDFCYIVGCLYLLRKNGNLDLQILPKKTFTVKHLLENVREFYVFLSQVFHLDFDRVLRSYHRSVDTDIAENVDHFCCGRYFRDEMTWTILASITTPERRELLLIEVTNGKKDITTFHCDNEVTGTFYDPEHKIFFIQDTAGILILKDGQLSRRNFGRQMSKSARS